MMDLSHKALNIEDLRQMARRRLTKSLYQFIDRGSEDDIALLNNRSSLERIKLLPRILNDVSGRNPSIKLFGKSQTLPLIIGPTGPAGFVWYRGEIALARAATKFQIPFTLSSTGNTDMERIMKDGGGTQWYQLYVWRDMEASLLAVERARDAGFEALIVTVDSTVPYNREFDIRNGVTFPVRITPRNFFDTILHPRWMFGTLGRYVLAEGHMPRYVNISIPKNLSSRDIRGFLTKNDTLNWEFLKRIRDIWPRTLIVKGILHPGDAVMAADSGADGIIVSNHGGIANDSAVAPVDVLPGIVEAAGKRLTIIVDSGFRRGSDVLKGLALGADAVAIGRATLYGVGAAGESGATRALEIFDSEIRRTMGVMGLSDIQSINRDHVILPGQL
ncbi:MAG: alpha-hydroxy acid oxidase [Alphaproteobacteria bacterium]